MSLHRYKHLIVRRLCAMAGFMLIVTVTAGVCAPAGAAAEAPDTSNNGSSPVSGFRALFVPAGFRSASTDRTRANLIRRLSPDAFAAMIETTLGGLRLPDGTQQRVSAAAGPLFTVTHDETLQGDGTNASPLGIKVSLNLNGSLNLSGALTVGGRGTGAGHSGSIGILASGGTGFAGATRGLAGRFEGDVEITGNLSKGGGSFKIDHLLDPENKYLSHSFVESPDMMNIYNGNVTTDANGDAVVELPLYFGALNRDFRYQLTVIGTFAQAIVAEKIKDNHFRIKTNSPNVEVSWQVTGIRQDAYANKNRIPVEQDKPEQERGLYLHPDAFGQPEEKSVLVVQHPDIMHQINEARDPSQKGKLR